MVLKATPEEIRTAGKNLVTNAETYLNSVKQLYETVDNLKKCGIINFSELARRGQQHSLPDIYSKGDALSIAAEGR